MSDLLRRAFYFGSDAHKGQARKYTGESYFSHCCRVVDLLEDHGVNDEEVLAAAYLHDVVEDTAIQQWSIRDKFGQRVMELVLEVTNPSKPTDGKRAVRKLVDRAHLAKASPDGKSIKLADIIDNLDSIVKYDPSFAAIYLVEKQLLMPYLTEGNKELWWLAHHTIEEGLVSECLKSPARTCKAGASNLASGSEKP